jgi:putative FmdB family regulatory protein
MRVPEAREESRVPTYQYACTECDHAFEQVQSFSEDALTVCPDCGGKLRKVFSAAGVVFKGSGFYRTDSRSSGSSSAAKPAPVSGS